MNQEERAQQTEEPRWIVVATRCNGYTFDGRTAHAIAAGTRVATGGTFPVAVGDRWSPRVACRPKSVVYNIMYQGEIFTQRGAAYRADHVCKRCIKAVAKEA